MWPQSGDCGNPVSDPLVEGEVWSDNGTLKISSG